MLSKKFSQMYYKNNFLTLMINFRYCIKYFIKIITKYYFFYFFISASIAGMSTVLSAVGSNLSTT